MVIEAAHFDGHRHLPDRSPPQAAHRGRRSGWSVASTRCCRPTPPTGSRTCWSSTAAAPISDGVTYVGSPPDAAGHHHATPTSPPGSPGMAIDADTAVRAPARGGLHGHGRRGRRDADRAAAHLATGPHRPLRPRRGGRPRRRLHERAVGAAAGAVRAAASPRASGCAAGSGFALAGAGLVEVKSWPFIGSTDLDRLRVAGVRQRRNTIRVANPLSDQRPLLTTTLLPGLLETAARNVGRGTTALGVYETAPVFLPTPERLKAPILGVGPATRRRRAREADGGRARPAADAGGRARRRPAGRPAGGARAARRAGPTPCRWCARWPGVLGVEVTVEQASREPWHPGRCARFRVGDAELGHAGELHPGVCEAYGVPAAHRRRRDRPRPADRRGAVRRTRAELLDLPRRQGGRRARRRRRPAGRACSRRRCGRAPASCSSRCGCSTSTPASRSATGKKSLAFALRFRAPDRTLTEAETGAARDAAVALAAERHGAVQR